MVWAINFSVRNYDVVEASDGHECLDKIETENPDVILLDLTMPGLSGWAVLEALKQKSLVSWAPVIVLTGWVDSEIHDKAGRLGAAGALVSSSCYVA